MNERARQAKPGEAMANHPCRRTKKTTMKQGDNIPIFAIYVHTRFLGYLPRLPFIS